MRVCFIYLQHTWRVYIQQQSSSFSCNRFIEHDVSTEKLGPSSGIRPSFLNRLIYTFMLLCLGVATYHTKIVLKNAKLFLEISSCLWGDCWKTKNSVVECKASENVCESESNNWRRFHCSEFRFHGSRPIIGRVMKCLHFASRFAGQCRLPVDLLPRSKQTDMTGRSTVLCLKLYESYHTYTGNVSASWHLEIMATLFLAFAVCSRSCSATRAAIVKRWTLITILSVSQGSYQ